MPSFLYMKILESSPERYDRGIQIISRGRINQIYEFIANSVADEGKKILDIGCGTGNVSLACAAKGASVVGIDTNPGMLEIAQKKADASGLSQRVEFLEIGVAEMKRRFSDERIDACVSCLAFSELTDDEQSYAISSAYSILKPGGIIIIADETSPRSTLRRVINALIQVPVRLLAYILTQSGTRPVKGIVPMLEKANFVDIDEQRIWGDTFLIVKAERGI